MKDGIVSNVNGPLPCTTGATWNFTGANTPTQEHQVACSIPGNPVATQKMSYTGGALQQCEALAKNITFTSFPTGNQCSHVIQLAAIPAPGEDPGYIAAT
jgi:hypothetical protein